MSKNTGDGELDNAATKTAHYLYDIEGECSPELYQAISTLRQLINEEFKPAKSLSSQFIYGIINPAAAQEANNARLDEATAIRKQFHGHRFGISEFMNNRIEELQNLTKEKESSDV